MTRSFTYRSIRLALLLCGGLLLMSLPTTVNWLGSSTSQAQTAIQLQPVVSGLTSPLYVTHAGDGSNRLFIIEQGGIIKVLQPGASTPTDFLNISTRVLAGGERGLLGLAFHPFYKYNGRFFVYYTRQTDGALRIAEYHVSAANPNIADTNETIILEIAHPNNNNHNGGTIQFGPDGYLYIGPGDGGGANDPANNAQNINSLLGKILRIDIDHPNGAIPYSAPASNPFFGATAGADEIYAVGMRNPYRFSFDRGGAQQLYAGDVGQGAWEEIDTITLGGNYGWRIMEGNHCNPNFNGGVCTPPANHVAPIAEYAHTLGRCSITGGNVYRGLLGTVTTGAYIYGDYCTGEIFMLNAGTQSLLLDTTRNISGFGEDELGELYVVGLGGTVERIVNNNAACTFAVNPSSQSFPASGGSGTVAVAATAACTWNTTGVPSWVTVNAGSGAGAGVVTYTVQANSSPTARSATLTIAGQPHTVLQGAAFNDVSPTDPFYNFIGKLSARGVTVGCGGGSYCPNANVTREQMAIFIERALGVFMPPTPAGQTFQDVPPDRMGYAFIEDLVRRGITVGCAAGPPRLYCPDSLVTREQMAIFIERALGVFTPMDTSYQRFADVPRTMYGFPFIDDFARRGITMGCGGGNYCPNNFVTRAEMAAFLVRAFNL